MEAWLSVWWVWIVIGLLLAILEVVAPAQIFLGFAVGAVGVGLGLAVGIPGFGTSIPVMLLVFAVISLIAWLLLRPLMGIRDGQVKHFEHDINED